MSYLIVGVALLALFLWTGRPGRVLKRPEWRISASVLAVGVFAAAAFVAARGGWGKALLLGVIGLGLTLSARWPRAATSLPTEAMSEREARSVLGVDAQATPADIKAAYARLIRIVHPDHGGAEGLASQLNRARDRLLKPMKR